jgi:tetratricopeptide (TPR) repeat protein
MEAETDMSQEPRLAKLREMVAQFPADPRGRLFLAHELFKAGEWAEAAANYDAYCLLSPGDEGAAMKNLGLCRERLGQTSEAAATYRLGIERALAHGHEGLASELRFLLAALDD